MCVHYYTVAFGTVALGMLASGFHPVPHICGVATWLNLQNHPQLDASPWSLSLFLSLSFTRFLSILSLFAATGLTYHGGSTSAKSPLPCRARAAWTALDRSSQHGEES